MSLRRRTFLSSLAATGAATASLLGGTPTGSSSKARPKKAGVRLPRRIIHMVSDGMSMGTLTCSDQLSHLMRGRGLTWMDLYNRPEFSSALVNMRSLNSLVTDSSAASSSWGSGCRIVNGTVNVLPDGRALKTLFDLLGDSGWKRGLVTTTEITHATPAGFGASGIKRDSADVVAEQYLERRIDLLLGGGRQYFDPAKRKDKRNLQAEFVQSGYWVMNQASDLETAPQDFRWLGTFASGHLPYTIDWRNDSKLQASTPTLAAMTRAALRKLDRESHFILQIEGGRVDHGCHNCDAAAAFNEQISLDEAIDVVLEYQRQQPETLVVMTTDHGNGNPGLNGMGDKYGDSSKLFKNLLKAKRSFSSMNDLVKTATHPSQVRQMIEECTGYKPSIERAIQLYPYLFSQGSTLYGTMNSNTAQLGQLMANYYGIGWTSGSHTSDYVTLLASGPGSEKFRGFIQNTDIFGIYLGLAGIDFRNPSVPLIADAGPSAGGVESSEDWA